MRKTEKYAEGRICITEKPGGCFLGGFFMEESITEL
jgi:hypothetical protein